MAKFHPFFLKQKSLSACLEWNDNDKQNVVI